MISDLDALATEEFASVKALISNRLNVPSEAVEKWGASGLMLSLLAGRENFSSVEFENVWLDFEKFCNSVENVPWGCLLYASIAYGLGALAMNEHDEKLAVNDRVRYMLTAAEARMAALFTYQYRQADQAKLEMAERRSMLSEAGAKGAQAKNAKFAAVRAWVLDKMAALKLDDRKSSRQLANQLPPHLADVSVNPERLIYDILRAFRKRS